jgi:N utilization substance protein B
MNKHEKRQARVLALKMIYSKEINGAQSKSTITKDISKVNGKSSKEVTDYAKQIFDLTFDRQDEVDRYIVEKSSNWDISRIGLIDKLIIRMSLVEMLYVNDVPPKVSIVEGVEIAKEYSTNDSGAFVNGILDSVYNENVKDKD